MHSDSERSHPQASKLRQLVIYLVVFTAGFGTALWIAAPPVVEAQGGGKGFLPEMEFDRGGLKIHNPGEGEFLPVVSTWGDGVPRSYPVPPGEGIEIPGEIIGDEWGLFEIRFRPCRYGNCTDPIPPPDLLQQGGLVVFDREDTRGLICKTCSLNKCCPDPNER